MPLDAGNIAGGRLGWALNDWDQEVRRRWAEAPHVGAALALLRADLGLSRGDIVAATHVRGAYIDAIEAFDLSRLPSRPFVIGYIRSYALALGLDPEWVVARFRAEAPSPEDGLQSPPGIRQKLTRRLAASLAIVVLVAGTLTVWNITRHLKPARAPVRMAAAQPAPPPATPAAVVASIGAPLPLPPEAATGEAPRLTPPTPGSTFQPTGAQYGEGRAVTLQALSAVSVIIRGPNGIQFARRLQAGESWSTGSTTGLVADVTSAGAVEVYLGGVAMGPLPATQTSLTALKAPKV
jgi:cytoskeleton protein RodZ